jgi:hypothetical protein
VDELAIIVLPKIKKVWKHFLFCILIEFPKSCFKTGGFKIVKNQFPLSLKKPA